MRIQLHIDQLVLHGFSPHDRYRIGDAVQRELETQIAANVLSNSACRTIDASRLDAGSFEIARDTRPAEVGGQIAQSVYRSLHTDLAATPRESNSSHVSQKT